MLSSCTSEDADSGVANLHAEPVALRGGHFRAGPDLDFSGVGELNRIGDQVAEQFPDPGRIAQHGLRQSGVEREEERKILGLRLAQVLPDGGVQHFADAEFAIVEGELAAFKRGVLQRGVEDFEQIFGAEARGVDVFPLLLIQSGFQQQIRHPDDAGQRRPDFMVQAGKEGSLELLNILVSGRGAVI